ncbi:MAG: sugar-transfer associated ATP-grasp domain-containing protein [Candidatus Pacebacteria bacterium]|nr:sugar-transfer associated ATP-grasp domain-containing protein [Candidatus Paceibacterota bacterium]
MNARNLDFIRPFNLSRAKRLADDKLLSKKVLAKNNLPVPKLIAKIKDLDQLEKFDWSKLPDSFALKPNRGFGGEGILVVYSHKKGRADAWVKADRSIITVEDLKSHIRNIIDGAYSLSGTPDIAFFEERLQLLKLFKPYAFKGIPDIRVIVFNKVPVMAMLRLPTKESGGKANLQQGALGVGIDLATGTTTTAVVNKSKIIEYVPDTRLLLSGIKIPYWKDILRLAVRAQEISGLGFLGADIAIDRERGPVFFELNARPGLSIQIANLSGLKERLEKVVSLKIKSIERGVRVGMDLFGGEIEEELEYISGKKLIGTAEKVKLIGKDGKEVEIDAKIDTGAYSTSIDTDIAKELGFADVISFFNSLDIPAEFNREEAKQVEDSLRKKYLGQHPDLADITVVYSSNGISVRPKISIKIILDNIEMATQVNIVERQELKKSALIGRRNLGKFLIDVAK